MRSGVDLEKSGGEMFGGGVEEGKDHLPDILFFGGWDQQASERTGRFLFFDFGRGFFWKCTEKEKEMLCFFFLLEDLLMVWRNTAIGLTMTLLFFQIMSWIERY